MRLENAFYGICDIECHSFFLLVLSVFGLATALDSTEFQKNLPAKIIWAASGKDAELPCDVTPALPGDNVSMIFWFKDGLGMPLYSLDARGGELSKASHLTIGDDLGARSYFIADEEPAKARLRIKKVKNQDQGVFRCRVDFINSPTRNFQVNLSLVVPPSAPRVFDAEGREVRPNSPAGPFLEGHELFLSCQVDGGFPRPSLTWWYNDTILDGVVDSSRASHTTVNQLVVRKIPRHFKSAKLECRTSSPEIDEQIIRNVPLTVYLKPNKVKIVSPNDLLSIRKSQNVRCETSGAYPPAKLTWLLDGKPIRNAVVTEEVTESFTGSILTLNVDASDDGVELACRADNPRFPGGSAQDVRQIHVAYPPRVFVKMDQSVRSPVKEGTDVILRCDATSRPPPTGYSWYHNNHLIAYNESSGILPIDHILTLKDIKQKSGGQYACSATNTEGESYSVPMDLDIQYTPRCKKGFEVLRTGYLPNQPIVVQCHVEAMPPVSRFSWTYNTSKGVLPVQGAKMLNTGNVSELHFNPGDEDFESLSCWASNEVGRQETPCLFFIEYAEAPEAPKNCFVRNVSHGGLEVSCLAGKDGGLHQTFILEVTDTTAHEFLGPGITTLSDQGEGTSPTMRVLNQRPVFHLVKLEPGRKYVLSIYAENAKGRSDPTLIPDVIVDGSYSQDPMDFASDGSLAQPKDRQDPGASSNGQGITIIVIGLTVAALLLIVGIITVATIVACRKPSTTVQRRRPRASSKPPSELELSEAGFGEGFHRRSALYRASMYGECEERISRLIEGPDLILAPVSFSPQSSEY